MSRREVLKLTNVHKIFGQGTVNENHVLKGLNLTLYEGDFVTVIGSNGAGKSTALNVIAGNYEIEEGSVEIGGVDVTDRPTAKRADKIAYVFQDTMLGTASRLTIEENMAIANRRGKKRGLGRGVTEADRQEFRKKLKILDLGLENRLTQEVSFLSGGQRQALTLLMATLRQPEILLLDEHTAALDPSTSEMVLELTDQIIKEQNLTALMITHNMQDALEHGNRLIMLDQGRIILDLTAEEKEGMTMTDLIQLFKEKSGSELTSDAMLLG